MWQGANRERFVQQVFTLLELMAVIAITGFERAADKQPEIEQWTCNTDVEAKLAPVGCVVSATPLASI